MCVYIIHKVKFLNTLLFDTCVIIVYIAKCLQAFTYFQLPLQNIINHIDRLFPIQECHSTQQNYRYMNLSSILTVDFPFTNVITKCHYSLWQVRYSVRAHK